MRQRQALLLALMLLVLLLLLLSEATVYSIRRGVVVVARGSIGGHRTIAFNAPFDEDRLLVVTAKEGLR